MANVQHKRGTLAALDALAGAGALKAGQVYLLTDEARLAVALSASTYQAFAKQGEGGGGDPWTVAKLAATESTSSGAGIDLSLGFAPQPNRTYRFEARVLLASDTASVGARLGWAWQSGNPADGAARVIVATGSTADAARHLDGGTTGAALANSVPLAGASFLGTIEGVLVTNGSAPGGTARVTLTPEIAGTAVHARAGSFLAWREV